MYRFAKEIIGNINGLECIGCMLSLAEDLDFCYVGATYGPCRERR